MKHSQAIVLLCVPFGTEDKLGTFLEDHLSLYSYEIETVPEIIYTLFNEGPAREAVFERIDEVFEKSPTAKILVFSDKDLSGVKNLKLFQKDKDLTEQFEMFLRHVVSILRARYKDAMIEVYIPSITDPYYKQLI